MPIDIITLPKTKVKKPKKNDLTVNADVTDVIVVADVAYADADADAANYCIDSLNMESLTLVDLDLDADADAINKTPKKRGRKPKGGKIIINNVLPETVSLPEPNIILHLKCGEADLLNTNFISKNEAVLDNFQFTKNNLGFELLQDEETNKKISNKFISGSGSTNSDHVNEETQIIWNKLKELTYNLHTNNLSDKKSACFWCTCDFDNPTIFLPKHELNNTYYCYGCFCSPECATAYLLKEPIDSSARFERYHLLNHIYCKIYNYKKNIKPAPDPFYTLDKFYGNLTIQEYRRLLKNERLLLIVDKPLSRMLPELHEDNDDFLCNSNLHSTTKFKLRRKTKQTKTDLLNENFNMK